MPSIERPLAGDALVFDMDEERRRLEQGGAVERSGRSARTLLKSGALRVTLVVLGPAGEIAEHEAEGPITVQPLEGLIRFSVDGRTHDLAPGQLIAVGGGVRHSVAAPDGGAFLLTLALEPREIAS